MTAVTNQIVYATFFRYSLSFAVAAAKTTAVTALTAASKIKLHNTKDF